MRKRKWHKKGGWVWDLWQLLLLLSNYSEIILNDHKCVIKVQRIITTTTTTIIREGVGKGGKRSKQQQLQMKIEAISFS